MRALVFATTLLVACGRSEVVEPAPLPDVSAGVAAPAAVDPNDPEPPDAQAKAEAVVFADFNKNKTTSLKMKMTTLVGRTSELSGFSTGLVAKEDNIEDKLTRLGARVTETEVTIQLSGAILFDFDSAAIRPDAERTLNDVSSVIASYQGRPVRIEGHTDSIASDQYNQKLSEQRAQSVVDWFAKSGIERGRLTATGLGESKPVATNETSAGRQQNRRVEIVIARR
ncbi:MAG TPA: OmpA family protein [Thermoanaerobaculia bacterium]|nr:OmpA family protein [Thermoanaerobaculia bacterium]